MRKPGTAIGSFAKDVGRSGSFEHVGGQLACAGEIGPDARGATQPAPLDPARGDRYVGLGFEAAAARFPEGGVDPDETAEPPADLAEIEAWTAILPPA